jgi:hypothetical protein
MTTTSQYRIPIRLRGADKCRPADASEELLEQGRSLLRSLLPIATNGFGIGSAEILHGLDSLVRHGRSASAILGDIEKASRG